MSPSPSLSRRHSSSVHWNPAARKSRPKGQIFQRVVGYQLSGPQDRNAVRARLDFRQGVAGNQDRRSLCRHFIDDRIKLVT